jgi:hypothetical protein
VAVLYCTEQTSYERRAIAYRPKILAHTRNSDKSLFRIAKKPSTCQTLVWFPRSTSASESGTERCIKLIQVFDIGFIQKPMDKANIHVCAKNNAT